MDRRIAGALLLAGATLAAACGSSGGAVSGGATTSTGAATYPVTIQDCGQTLTFTSAPKRVVILNPAIADGLIELGLGDRIVGQSGTELAATLPQYESVMARVPTLSPGRTTSTEVLLGATPDLIISDLAYRLDPSSGGASQTQLQAAGIKTYIAAGGCTNEAGNGTVSDVFTDIANLGRIFGVEGKAEALTSQLQATLTDTTRRVANLPRVSVFEFLPIDGQYYPVGGLEQDAIGLSGGTTVFPNVNSTTVVSAEEIAAADPQVLIELTEPGTPIDQQSEIASLKQAFPTIDAVKNGRVYFLDAEIAGGPASIRIISGIRTRAMMLHPGAF